MESISAREVAARTGIALQTLANWRHQGIGPPYRKVGARVLYVWDEVVAWRDKRKVGK